MSGECMQIFPRLGIPQLHFRFRISSNTGKFTAIRAEHYAPNRVSVPGEHLQIFPRFDIPQSHRSVLTPAGERTAVRAERYAFDRSRMASEPTQMFPRCGVPQVHRHKQPPAGKCVAVRAERYARDRAPQRIPDERAQMFPRFRIPQPHCPVPMRPATGKKPPIWAERYALDIIQMAGEQGDLFKRRRIIDPDTDGTGDGKPSPIRGICCVIYLTFTESRLSAIR